MNPFILALLTRNLKVKIYCLPSYRTVLSNDKPFNSTISGTLCESIHGFYDKRVNRIVEYSKENYFQSDIISQTFADIVFLSPSYLAFLFKQQTGSSLSKYLLWTRLHRYLSYTLRHREKPHDRAYETVFYDLAPFNKYMG